MNEQILNKIKKLLELTNSPYPAEAKAAYKKARDLMDRHALSDEDLAEHKQIKYVYHEISKDTIDNLCMTLGVPTGDMLNFHGGLARFVDSISVQFPQKLQIWGPDFQISCFKYLFESLINQGYVKRKEAIAAFGLQAYHGFWPGFFQGLITRFRLLTEEGTKVDEGTEGLVHVSSWEKTRDHVHTIMPGIKRVQTEISMPGTHGIDAAQKVSLGAGIGSATRMLK